MNVTDQIALVTGANRGIGRQFVLELLERGASKVYATGRRRESLDFDDPRVVPLRLDIVDHESVIAAAATARDATILVNNAGISTGAALVTGDLDEIHREMDTHFWGTLDVIREFSPVLAANGGGAIVNILSALSWFASPGAGSYAADTDLMAGYDGPKIDPRDVPRRSLDGLAADSIEVIVDDWTAIVKASLAGDPAAFYAQITELLGAS